MSMPDITPSDLLPPELAPEQPLTRDELAELMEWVDHRSVDAPSVLEFVADVVAGASDVDPDAVVPAGVSWRIRSDGEAEWAMAHLAEATTNLAAIDAQRAAYVERIDTWTKQLRRAPERDAAFFRGHLEAYAIERRLRVGDKAATLALPDGTVRTTRQAAKPVVTDDEAVAAWARANLSVDEARMVVRSKVLVSELAKLVAVADAPTGRLELMLNCGCILSVEAPAGREVKPGDRWDCPTCDDAEVDSVQVEVEQVVVEKATGERVAGAVVQPEHLTAKATPK